MSKLIFFNKFKKIKQRNFYNWKTQTFEVLDKKFYIPVNLYFNLIYKNDLIFTINYKHNKFNCTTNFKNKKVDIYKLLLNNACRNEYQKIFMKNGLNKKYEKFEKENKYSYVDFESWFKIGRLYKNNFEKYKDMEMECVS